MTAPDRYSADEIRCPLGISVQAAQKVLDLAVAVCRREPRLYEAMAAGELDETRAWAIAHWTKGLSDEHAQLVVGDVLPHCLLSAAEPWVTGKVIAEIKKLAIALDPDWAERLYADAVRQRRVVAWRNADGTADLAGQQLEADRVAGACGRIKKLAKTAKRDGDPRPIDQIRADLYLGNLDGTYAGMTEAEMLADYALTRPESVPETTNEPAEALAEPEPAAEPAAEPAGDALPDPVREAAKTSARQSPHIGVQLMLKLSTLLGIDQHPGELVGWGPMDPAHSRALARSLSHGMWRYAITYDDERLNCYGLVSARPEGWRPRRAWSKGILDIIVPATLLRQLLDDPDTHREWRAVLEDLAEGAARHAHTRIRREAEHRRAPKPKRGKRGRPATHLADPRRRTPNAELRRRLELKLRGCIGYGCTRPSRQAEMDHSLDYAMNGLTVESNLGPACGHDHALKTKGGWRLDRATDLHGRDTFTWITRLGRRYTVAVKPLIEDLPGPGPAPAEVVESRPDPDRDRWGRRWQDSELWLADPRQRSRPETDGYPF